MNKNNDGNEKELKLKRKGDSSSKEENLKDKRVTESQET